MIERLESVWLLEFLPYQQFGSDSKSTKRWFMTCPMEIVKWWSVLFRTRNKLSRFLGTVTILFSVLPEGKGRIMPFFGPSCQKKGRKRQNKRAEGHCRFRLADSWLLLCSLCWTRLGVLIWKFLLIPCYWYFCQRKLILCNILGIFLVQHCARWEFFSVTNFSLRSCSYLRKQRIIIRAASTTKVALIRSDCLQWA